MCYLILKQPGEKLTDEFLKQTKLEFPGRWETFAPDPDKKYMIQISGKYNTPLCCSQVNNMEIWHFGLGE